MITLLIIIPLIGVLIILPMNENTHLPLPFRERRGVNSFPETLQPSQKFFPLIPIKKGVVRMKEIALIFSLLNFIISIIL